MPVTSQRIDDIRVSRDRIVVLGDPHGDLPGLEGVLEREAGPDTQLVSVGDNIGYADGRTSSLLCHALEEREIPSVRGNHEEWMDDEGNLAIVRPSETPARLSARALAWSRTLPWGLRLVLDRAPDLRVLVRHHVEDSYFDFVPDDLVARGRSLESEITFVGHTHAPAISCVDLERGTATTQRLELSGEQPLRISLQPGFAYIVNAGSLAKPGNYPEPSHPERASYAVLDTRHERLELHSFEKATSLRSS